MPCRRTQHLLPLALCLLLAACKSGGTAALLQDVDATQLHAVMSGQIAVQVGQLNVLLFDLHRTQTELEAERRRRIGEIIEAADLLQRSADTLLALEPGLELAPENRPRFTALAQGLRQQAETLSQQATEADLSALERTMARVNATCDSCHQLYRAP